MALRSPLVRAGCWATVLVAGLTAWHLVPAVGADLEQQVSAVVRVLAAAVACGLGLWHPAARPRGTRPTASRMFVLVSLSWLLADAVWVVQEPVLHRHLATPNLADPLYALALLAAIAATALRLRGLVTGASAVRTVLDGLLLGESVSWGLWVMLLADGDHLSVAWVFPVLGAVAASLCFVIASRLPPPNRLPWLLRACGLLAVGAADAVRAYHDTLGTFTGGDLTDVLRVAGYLLVGLGALAARVTTSPDPTGSTVTGWELVVPYPPVVAALLVAVIRVDDLQSWHILGISAISLLLVARQLLSVQENGRLTQTLETRVAERTRELREREGDLRTILQRISDVIAIVDTGGHLGYVSSSVEELLGRDPDSLVGTLLVDEVHPADRERVAGALAEAAGASRLLSLDLRLRRADGTWCPIEAKLTPVKVGRGDGSVLATFRDVTERRAFEARLLQQAYHDKLTGLANRARLAEELDAALRRGARPSMVLLDLDEFKAINDTAGHQLGDEVLVAVAARLRACTRPHDLVVRLGGDEFAVLLPSDPGGGAAEVLADRILLGLETALPVRGRAIRCGGSIGVAALRDGGAAEDLIRDADVAMYVAKRKGRGRIERFTSDMHESVLRRRAAEEQLRAVVMDGTLVVHYQPIVELGSGRVVGFEALARLPDGAGGLIPPADFIPIAEETSLVVPLGARVLARACADALGWQELRPDGPPVGVSVNLSTRQLQDPALCATVQAALRGGLAPELLTLEITEGALADDADTEATLHRLRSIGVRLSVDDFGAGYSSLGRLRSLPVDELKIDRSFVDPRRTDPDDAVVEAVLALGERLGLTVVAEGIETAEQAARLWAIGCRYAQGYHFAEPAPTAEVVALLARNMMETDSTSVANAV